MTTSTGVVGSSLTPRTVVAKGQEAVSFPSGASRLGGEAFLKLLVAELQYQNPMEPLKDRDFIAQLAQFNSLDALNEIRDKLGGLETLKEIRDELRKLATLDTIRDQIGQLLPTLEQGLAVVTGGEGPA